MITPWRQMEKGERVRSLTSGWPMLWPAVTVILAIIACAVIPVVTTLTVLPDLPLALLVAWRIYRPDLIAPWGALPLGIVADIFTGQPVGISATIWPAALLALALIEPRFPVRDLRLDWGLGTGVIALAKLLGWELLALAHFHLPALPILLGILSTSLFFPVVARIVAWVEGRWLTGG